MAGGISVGAIYAEAELDIRKFQAAAGQLEGEATAIAGSMALAAAGMAGAQAAVAALGGGAISAAARALAGAGAAGRQFSAGLAGGILAGRSGVVNAARQVALSAAQAARSALQIHSPSRVAEGFGEFFDLGFVRGLRNGQPEIDRAIEGALAIAPPRPAERAAESAAPRVGGAVAIDYERLAGALRQLSPVLELDGRTVARVNSENTAQVQNARARNIAMRYGGR